MHRFFNAGHKIEEVFSFSLPADSGADVHVTGRWNMIAPKQGWFEVPRELAVGASILAVQFAGDIKRRFGRRGVVLLDPVYDVDTEDPDKPLEFYAVAPTPELVIERAEKLWDNYLEEICKAHFEDVQNAMSAGGAPRAARGFTIHALKLKGYRDPASDFFLRQKDGSNGHAAGFPPELAAMMAAQQAQTQAMMGVVLAIATGQKIDPETLKSMMAPNGAPQPQTPLVPPDNAGQIEVEGAGQSSLEQRISRRNDDGYVRGQGNLDKGTLKVKTEVAPKKQRAAEAARAL